MPQVIGASGRTDAPPAATDRFPFARSTGQKANFEAGTHSPSWNSRRHCPWPTGHTHPGIEFSTIIARHKMLLATRSLSELFVMGRRQVLLALRGNMYE